MQHDARPRRPAWRYGWSVGVLLLLPFLSHVVELTGLANTDPLLFISSIARHSGSGLVPGKPFLDGNAAQTTEALGHLAAEDWLHGSLPWWNPYTGVGLPLASEMQPAAFFLPFTLLMHFQGGITYLKIAMQVLAGLFTLAFLRRLGLRPWAACLGAIMFECNGTFAWFSDAPILPVAFLPLLLLGVEVARDHAAIGRSAGATLIALSVSGALLAGFPETAYLDGLLALCWAIMRAWALPLPFLRRFVGSVALGGVTGLLLSLPALAPFLLDLRFSTVGLHAESTAVALGWTHALILLLPYLFGNIWANDDFTFWIRIGGYLGLAVPTLACLSLLNWRQQRGERLLFTGWILLLVPGMFHLPGFSQLWNTVPGLADVQLGRYGMASVQFAAASLAARALDDYFHAGRLEVSRLQGTVICAALAVVIVGALNRLAHDDGGTPESGVFAVSSVVWALVSTCTILFAAGRPGGRNILASVVVLDAACLFLVPTLAGLSRTETDTGPIDFLRAHQGLSRALSTDDTLFPNYGALVQLGMVQYEYIPVSSDWAAYVHDHLDAKAAPNSWPGMETKWQRALDASDNFRAFETVGVRYIVSPTAVDLFGVMTAEDVPTRVYRQNGTDIFELRHPAPYAETVGGACRLTITTRELLQAQCRSPATLIRRELFFPGWRVRVNGEIKAVGRALTLFQSVELGGGKSEVVWSYRPPYSRLMWTGFAIGLILFGISARAETGRSGLPSAQARA